MVNNLLLSCCQQIRRTMSQHSSTWVQFCKHANLSTGSKHFFDLIRSFLTFHCYYSFNLQLAKVKLQQMMLFVWCIELMCEWRGFCSGADCALCVCRWQEDADVVSELVLRFGYGCGTEHLWVQIDCLDQFLLLIRLSVQEPVGPAGIWFPIPVSWSGLRVCILVDTWQGRFPRSSALCH